MLTSAPPYLFTILRGRRLGASSLAQFNSLFITGKNCLSIVQITHQFKFFTLGFLSRKNVEKEFVTSIQFVACALRGNLSNRSSGAQIPRDICTRFGRYLYSTKCSWVVNKSIAILLGFYSFKIIPWLPIKLAEV